MIHQIWIHHLWLSNLITAYEQLDVSVNGNIFVLSDPETRSGLARGGDTDQYSYLFLCSLTLSAPTLHRPVARSLSVEAAKTLVQVFVSSRLDYCNAVYYTVYQRS